MERKFIIYTKTLGANEAEKFDILINRLDFTPYEYVDKTTSYKEAMDKLEKIYDKKINTIYARWKLANEKQLEDESMDAFVLRLMVLAKDCDFKDVTAVEHKNESVLQSFVSGLEDNYIRQRILENDVVTLEDALKCADILKRAKVNAGKYESSETFKSTVAQSVKKKQYQTLLLRTKMRLIMLPPCPNLLNLKSIDFQNVITVEIFMRLYVVQFMEKRVSNVEV